MQSASADSLLHAVAEVAGVAGEAALKYFRTGVAVDLKSDGSPVTIADRTAEEVARAWIARRFPSDAVLGEEFGGTMAGAGRRWIIDPIDGTKSFIRGVPLWGTLIAVADGEEILAGAINCAAVGELLAAAPGAGSWLNGVRCRVSEVSQLSQATLLTTDDRFPGRPSRREHWTGLTRAAGVSRSWGDCYGYLLVASGRAEVMVDDLMNPWDSAPLLCILEEAGGVLTDWRGRRTAFGGDTIATNRALAEPVRAVLTAGEG